MPRAFDMFCFFLMFVHCFLLSFFVLADGIAVHFCMCAMV